MTAAKLRAATAIAKQLSSVDGMKKGQAIKAALKKAELGDVHFESVKGKLRRALKPKQPTSRLSILSEECEKLLVELVAASSVGANPLSGLEVRVLAQTMGDLDKVPSTGWLQKLRQRHPEKIKLRKSGGCNKETLLLSLKQYEESIEH